MDKEDFIKFLRGMLKKIEDAELLLSQPIPKHIPAYHKILGIQQKLETIPCDVQKLFFVELIRVRGIITYFLNGKYVDGMKSLYLVKKRVIQLIKENERDNNR